MALDLSGLISQANGLIPSATAIEQNLALGVASSVLLSGIQAQVANGSIPDPLGLFHKAQGTPAPAPTNNPNLIVGPTITQSAFQAMPAATQQQLLISGVHIVSG